MISTYAKFDDEALVSIEPMDCPIKLRAWKYLVVFLVILFCGFYIYVEIADKLAFSLGPTTHEQKRKIGLLSKQLANNEITLQEFDERKADVIKNTWW